MKEIVILSGKGGTGKTSIVGSLAAIADSKIMVDCDVDAADLHLLLRPSVKEERDFISGKTATINEKECNQCGLCQDLCRFDAIRDYTVDPVSCEGCGFCYHICPVEAIQMKECISGRWFISDTAYGPLVHARLGIGEENSGKLVALIRGKAREIAEKENLDYIISDGPPGIGCPVISSLSGVDLALLVTEPTLSGIQDLERVIQVCRHFGIPAVLCINKYDLNEDNTHRIEKYCLDEGIEIVAHVPFDNIVTESIVQGIPVVEYSKGNVSAKISEIWRHISERCR